MLFKSSSLFLITYIIVLIFDIILETYFKNKHFFHNYIQFINKYDFFTLYIILFVNIFLILTLFSTVFYTPLVQIRIETSNLYIGNYVTYDNISHFTNLFNNKIMTYDNKVINTLNINHLNDSIKILCNGVNTIYATTSLSGGAAIAATLIKKIKARIPALKLMVGLGVIAGVQLFTTFTANALSQISGNNITNISDAQPLFKYLSLVNSYTDKGVNLLNDGFGDLLIKIYSDYPLSLLFELNRLINIEIIFMFILINIFLIKKVSKIDLKKYLPENKTGQIIENVIGRYIQTWSSISNYMVYLAIGMIIYSIILSKLVMVLISIS